MRDLASADVVEQRLQWVGSRAAVGSGCWNQAAACTNVVPAASAGWCCTDTTATVDVPHVTESCVGPTPGSHSLHNCFSRSPRVARNTTPRHHRAASNCTHCSLGVDPWPPECTLEAIRTTTDPGLEGQTNSVFAAQSLSPLLRLSSCTQLPAHADSASGHHGPSCAARACFPPHARA